MKKFASLVIAGALAVASLTACSNSDAGTTTAPAGDSTQASTEEQPTTEAEGDEQTTEEATDEETTEEADVETTVEDEETESNNEGELSLEDMIDQIYEKAPLGDMMVGSMPIDLTDENAPFFYMGINDTTGIEEAWVSEPMIGSIGYSMVVAKISEDADIKAIGEEIFNNVNQSKWICVSAEHLTVANCGNIILMVMVNDSLAETVSDDDLAAAFAEVCGGTLENVLTRDEVGGNGGGLGGGLGGFEIPL